MLGFHKKKQTLAFITRPIRWSLPSGSSEAYGMADENKKGMDDLTDRLREGFEIKHMSTSTLQLNVGSVVYAHYVLELR